MWQAPLRTAWTAVTDERLVSASNHQQRRQHRRPRDPQEGRCSFQRHALAIGRLFDGSDAPPTQAEKF